MRVNQYKAFQTYSFCPESHFECFWLAKSRGTIFYYFLLLLSFNEIVRCNITVQNIPCYLLYSLKRFSRAYYTKYNRLFACRYSTLPNTILPFLIIRKKKRRLGCQFEILIFYLTFRAYSDISFLNLNFTCCNSLKKIKKIPFRKSRSC